MHLHNEIPALLSLCRRRKVLLLFRLKSEPQPNRMTPLGFKGHYMTACDAYTKYPASHRVTVFDMKNQYSI